MMDYTESICFSAETAEELNRKAFSLDCRLFMFAYYEPKQYREAESKRSQFLTAIVNLYGLFKDCGPFLGELLKTRDTILVYENGKQFRMTTICCSRQLRLCGVFSAITIRYVTH